MGLYSRLAPHYDALFPVSEVQARCLRERLAGAGRVLDAGCGTGRHLELLRDWGHEPVGLEPDPRMAALARARLGPGAQVLECALEDAAGALGEPCDAALCLGNTLAHLLDEAALAAGLGALHGATAPGGLLITQTVNFDRVLAAGRAEFPTRRIPDGAGGTLTFERDYDFGEAPARLGFVLTLRGKGVDLHERFPLRPWTEAEQRAALVESGFAVAASLGDWDGRLWSADAPACILVAE